MKFFSHENALFRRTRIRIVASLPSLTADIVIANALAERPCKSDARKYFAPFRSVPHPSMVARSFPPSASRPFFLVGATPKIFLIYVIRALESDMAKKHVMIVLCRTGVETRSSQWRAPDLFRAGTMAGVSGMWEALM